MKNLLIWTVIATFVSVAVACDSSDPNELTEATIRKALESHYSKAPACLVTHVEFPFTTNKSLGPHVTVKEQLSALVKAGLVDAHDVELEQERGFPKIGGGTEVQKIPGTRYTVTAAGKEHLSKKKGPLGRERDAFCYGDWTVTEVSGFTPPVERLGKTVSEVTFLRQIATPAPWTKEMPELVDGLEPEQQKEAFVLTAQGWAPHSTQ